MHKTSCYISSSLLQWLNWNKIVWKWCKIFYYYFPVVTAYLILSREKSGQAFTLLGTEIYILKQKFLLASCSYNEPPLLVSSLSNLFRALLPLHRNKEVTDSWYSKEKVLGDPGTAELFQGDRESTESFKSENKKNPKIKPKKPHSHPLLLLCLLTSEFRWYTQV